MTVTDSSLATEILDGLRGSPRRLPCKLLYDEPGSALFERICETPEYYLTRTEIGILQERLGAISAAIGPGAEVVEFGSGSGRKTRLLLDALTQPTGLCLIDISPMALEESIGRLQAALPRLTVHGVEGDFTAPIDLPAPSPATRRRVVFFPGSTIGNFTPEEAVGFLDRARRLAGPDGLLLLGTDMVKDPEIIEAAYNDRIGYTGAFNRNLLHHCNRLLGGDCQPERFAHRAPWDPKLRRIDMLLEAREDLSFSMGGEHFRFAAGDTIHTEHSHKFRPQDVIALAEAAGWELERSWYDAEAWFGVHLLG